MSLFIFDRQLLVTATRYHAKIWRKYASEPGTLSTAGRLLGTERTPSPARCCHWLLLKRLGRFKAFLWPSSPFMLVKRFSALLPHRDWSYPPRGSANPVCPL